MVSLPFNKLQQAEQLLRRVPLEDLVLMFPGREENAFLLVYNRDEIPELPEKTWVAKRLEDLNPSDYAKSDKPIIGFSALDVAFPYIPTHGVNFYPIEQTTAYKGMRDIYLENAYHLAQWLRRKCSGSSTQIHRCEAKVVELALLKALPRRAENMVAGLIRSESKDFPNDLPDSVQWMYTKDIDELGQEVYDAKTWIVGLEEIGLFNSALGLKNRRFIELRTILQQIEITSALQQTRLKLAQICWNEWQTSGDGKFKETAYSLGSEAWLAERDVENLVAVLPHHDFEHFLRTGAALHISLVPCISQAVNREQVVQYSLGDLVNKRIPAEVLQKHQTPPLSFSSLAPAFEWTSEKLIDLGPVLYKGGHEAELARTFCLLSSDLLKYPDVWKLPISSEDITNLALRAAIALSLSNPWHKQWRARYPQMLEHTYLHLAECWSNQENRAGEPLKTYYRALREWYECFKSQDIPLSLGIIQSACRNFREITENRTDLNVERDYTQHIQDIVRKLLGQSSFSSSPSSELPLTHFEVAEHLRLIADSRETVPLLSIPFGHLLENYQKLHAKWQGLQEELKSGQIREEHFARLLDRFASLHEEAYAPAHEAKLVQWVCNQDIQRIARFRTAFKLGPMLRLRVLNPAVVLEKQERLFVEVENVGGATALDVAVVLNPSQRFEFTSGSSSTPLFQLEPQQSHRLEWEILPKDSSLVLRFLCRYRDAQGAGAEFEEERQIDVLLSKGMQIRPRGGNPFQAGVAVSGDRFFGRSEELKRILNLLLGGITQPILLRGPRRIGKSSILYQLRHLLTTEGETRKLEFSREEEISLQQVRPVITSLQEIPDINYIGRWFHKVFQDICKSVGNGYLFNEEQMKKDFDDQLPHVAFQNYIDRLFELRPEIRLMVMIDEWDEQRNLPGLAANLRYVMQAEQRVNWIISSTWTLREESGRYGSPFYSQASVMELKEMTWDAAEAMIRGLSDKAGVNWQGDAMVTLLDQTARRPYLTQWLCQELINYLYIQSYSLVDRETINIVLSNFIKTPQIGGQPFAFLWEANIPTGREIKGAQPRLYQLGRLILWLLDSQYPQGMTFLEIKNGVQRILQGKVETGDNLFDVEFAEQMIQLEYIFDAIKLEAQQYSFCVPLERQWFHYVVGQHPSALEEICNGVERDFAQKRKNLPPEEAK